MFNVVAKSGFTREKKLQVDTNSNRESHNNRELHYLAWLSVHASYADDLTKETFRHPHPLWEVMKTNKVRL